MTTVGFLGPGGTGKTTAVANVAACLALHGVRTLLVDANVYSPDVGYHFGVEASYTLLDYHRDPSLQLEWFITPVRFLRGLHLILGDPVGTDIDPGIFHSIRRLIWRLSDQYAVVVVDFPPSLPYEASPLLDALDMRVLVLDPCRAPVDDIFSYVAGAVGRFRPHGIILNFVELPDVLLNELYDFVEDELGIPVLASIPPSEHIRLEPLRGVPSCLKDENLPAVGLNLMEVLCLL